MKLLVLCLALFLVVIAAYAAPMPVITDAVPTWFRENPARPYSIFDAPKHLSARGAALYLGEEWTTLGGRLEDRQGHPLPLCRISINNFGGIRSYSANLCTDKNGYFLIYSPYSLRGCTFSATPGYPDTDAATQYAGSQNDIKPCDPSLLYHTADRAFYQLVVDSRNKFSPAGWEKFSRDLSADLAKQAAELPTLPDRGTISGSEPLVTTTFPLRLIDRAGRPLPQALISLGGVGESSFGFSSFGQGAALTDIDGKASLTETLINSPLKKGDYRRMLIINAPGSSFGPASVTLNPKKTTTITLETPATVEGQVRNAAGLPDADSLTLSYLSPAGAAFSGVRISTRPDGTFVFPRVVPGIPFQIILGNDSNWQVTPSAPVESRILTLKPGETCPGIQLQAVQPAALRGIITDTQGQPVPVGEATQYPNQVNLTLLLPDAPAGYSYGGPIGAFNPDFPRQVIYEGTGGWVWGDFGPGFGFIGLGAGPFRLRVTSEHYQPYLSEPIHLEPGELRFVKIVLQPKASPAP